MMGDPSREVAFVGPGYLNAKTVPGEWDPLRPANLVSTA